MTEEPGGVRLPAPLKEHFGTLPNSLRWRRGGIQFRDEVPDGSKGLLVADRRERRRRFAGLFLLLLHRRLRERLDEVDELFHRPPRAGREDLRLSLRDFLDVGKP